MCSLNVPRLPNARVCACVCVCDLVPGSRVLATGGASSNKDILQVCVCVCMYVSLCVYMFVYGFEFMHVYILFSPAWGLWHDSCC